MAKFSHKSRKTKSPRTSPKKDAAALRRKMTAKGMSPALIQNALYMQKHGKCKS